METQLELPITHQHRKKRTFAPEELDTIEVERAEQRPMKKPIVQNPQTDEFTEVPQTTSKVYVPKDKVQPPKRQPTKQNTQTQSPARQQTISHPDRESKVLKDIAKSKQSIDSGLQNMLSHYKEINDNEFLFSAHNPIKEQQIRSFLTRLKKEKKERHQRISHMSVDVSSARQSKDQHTNSQQAIVQRKQQIQERYQRRMQELQRNQQRRQEEHNRFKQFYRQYKSSKPVFIVNQEKQKEEQANQQRYKEQLLKDHAKKYKPISQQQFEEHIRRHEQAMQRIEQKKREERQEFLERIQEENSKLEGIWRGFYYQHAAEEKAERKRKMEQPKEKAKKIREYSLEVRQNYLPKSTPRKLLVREADQNETETNGKHFRRKSKHAKDGSPGVHRLVKHYKYLKGQFVGEILEKQPIQRSQQEKRLIGNSYLEMVKRLPKKIQYEPQPQLPPEPPKKKEPVPKQARITDPLYQQSKRINLGKNPHPQSVQMALYAFKHIDDRIHQQQKVLRLKQLPSVLQYQQRQRSINMKLVKGIEEKLNLLAQM